MAGRSLCFTSDPAEAIIYDACSPPTLPALPEEIRLDLWPSFTSPRIKAAVCSYGPGPHESNFIDHLESYRHPLNTKCRCKATGCGGDVDQLQRLKVGSPALGGPAVMKPQRPPLINMEISLPIRFFTTEGD